MEEIDKLITERLEEHERKMNRVKEFNKKKHRNNTPVIALLCAACLAFGIFMIWPHSESTDEDLENYRGGETTDYEQMDKQDAIQLLDKEIYISDSIISSLSNQDQDEETAYAIEEEKMKKEDLLKKREKISKK